MSRGAEYHRQWRAKNREQQRVYHLAYYYANKPRIQANAIARGEPARARARAKQWKQANPDRVKANGQRFREKHREEERARRRAYWAANKDKICERRREHDAANSVEARAKKAAYSAKYRARDRADGRANWLQAHPERRGIISKKYKAKNTARYAALAAKRRAQKMQATPAWADLAAIKAVYERAAEQGLTVDHIVPLQGKTVCGLHVETNLQLLSRPENSRKHNRFEPERHAPIPAFA
jgi:hypothetical protein